MADLRSMLAPRQGRLTAYDPPLREDLAWALAEMAGRMGVDKYKQQWIAQKVGGLVDLIPGVGEAVGVDEAKRDYDAGNYGMAAAGMGLTAAGALPVVGDVAAKAGKQGIRAFHASRSDFDEFVPSPHRGASFFASSPNRAKDGAGAGQSEMAMETASAYEKDTRPIRTYEVNIDPEHISGLNYTPAERQWFDSLPAHLPDDDAFNEILKTRPPAVRYLDDVYREVQTGPRSFEYFKNEQPPSISYEEAYTTGRDVYGRQHAHWGPQSDERGTAKRIAGDGMKGWLVNDEAGLSIAVVDPAIIEIVRKYGLAGAVSAGIISQEMADEMRAQGIGEGA